MHWDGTHEPTPARALNTSSGRIEFRLEFVERSPTLIDGVLEGTVPEFTAVALVRGRGGCKILPEERVIDMACA